jgi:membrane-associated PAP2 superfamily phosphatase
LTSLFHYELDRKPVLAVLGLFIGFGKFFLFLMISKNIEKRRESDRLELPYF